MIVLIIVLPVEDSTFNSMQREYNKYKAIQLEDWLLFIFLETRQEIS